MSESKTPSRKCPKCRGWMRRERIGKVVSPTNQPWCPICDRERRPTPVVPNVRIGKLFDKYEIPN
jgi:hypothetical protein